MSNKGWLKIIRCKYLLQYKGTTKESGSIIRVNGIRDDIDSGPTGGNKGQMKFEAIHLKLEYFENWDHIQSNHAVRKPDPGEPSSLENLEQTEILPEKVYQIEKNPEQTKILLSKLKFWLIKRCDLENKAYFCIFNN